MSSSRNKQALDEAAAAYDARAAACDRAAAALSPAALEEAHLAWQVRRNAQGAAAWRGAWGWTGINAPARGAGSAWRMGGSGGMARARLEQGGRCACGPG